MTLPTTPEEQAFARRDWRVLLEREYQPTSQRLQQAYSRIAAKLRPDFDALNQRIREIYEATGRVTPEDVRGLPQFARLLTRIDAELSDFAVIARNEADQLAQRMIPFGSEMALDMALQAAGRVGPAVQAAWMQPNPEALARLIGYTDSDVFRAKWASFGENAARTLQDLYLVGIAQGKNPLAVARLANAWLGVPYAWAENSARTAMIWSSRVANHATYAANDNVLDGWYWSSANDPRTCMSCWDQDGSFHPLTEILTDHHRGRCAPVPAVKGVTREKALGRDIFEDLDGETQRRIMGRGMWDAWKRGDVRWGEFSEPYQDDVYGEMLRARSLRSLGIKAA